MSNLKVTFRHTFRTGGFVIKSSNGSSGLTVVKFSCKIPIFFSLSHPDGLKEMKKYEEMDYFLGIRK